VTGRNACAIVEGGVSALASKILADIEASGLPSPLKYLIAAHGHADHVMGLLKLKHNFPQLIMAGSKETGRILAKEKIIRNFAQDDVMYADYLREGGHFPDPADSPDEPLELDLAMEDGGILDLGGVQLKFIACPGHAPDNTVIQVEPDHAFLLSDSAGYASAYNDILPLFFYSYRSYLEGLARIKSLAPGHIALGHNVLISGEPECRRFLDLAADQAIKMRESILRRIQDKAPVEETEEQIADQMSRYGLFKAFPRNRPNRGPANPLNPTTGWVWSGTPSR